MDSLQFYKAVVLADLFNRDKSDLLLGRVLSWVAQNAVPERTFSEGQLDHWATTHGYVKHDTAELVAALREAQRYVVAPSLLSSTINDLIYKYRQT